MSSSTTTQLDEAAVMEIREELAELVEEMKQLRLSIKEKEYALRERFLQEGVL